MGRYEPWLDYKGALVETREIELKREKERRKKSYGWALFWLVTHGPIGAHKFYVRKPATGFLFLSAFIIFMVSDTIFYHAFNGMYVIYFQVVFFVYWLAMIFVSREKLKQDVYQINIENSEND